MPWRGSMDRIGWEHEDPVSVRPLRPVQCAHRTPLRATLALQVVLTVMLGCSSSPKVHAQGSSSPYWATQPGAPGAGYPSGSYPQGPYPPPGTPSGPYPPGGAPTSTPPSPPGTAPPGTGLPPRPGDPINAVDLSFLRTRSEVILRELVAALPPAQGQRVAGIPLVVDDTVGEVNAFAACTQSGKSAMAISDGLLEIGAFLAQCRATDEVFGQSRLPAYIELIARQQRPRQPIVRPPPGFFNAAQAVDGRKVGRQHEVLDELIAFVLGHELGHHYLGHLPCTAQGGLPMAEIGAILSSAVPLFNQPNEYAADVAGTNNVLAAGGRRPGYRWTEAGGLLTMQFFSGLDHLSPDSILFGFERSHPPPQFRSPVIQQAAAAYRLTGGGLLPLGR